MSDATIDRPALDSANVAALAAELRNCFETGQTVAPLRTRTTSDDVDTAYAIQDANTSFYEGQGRRLVGRKIGLTSKVVQAQLGVDQPDFGVLLDDMRYQEADAVPIDNFVSPRVEPEVGLVLGRDLTGPGVTPEAAAKAVAAVVPSLEIIDSRIRDWRISIHDTIADNASSGGFVLGQARMAPADVPDIRGIGLTLHRNGAQVATGTSADVLGSPYAALAWLANTVCGYGITLVAGQVVLPGSLTAAQPVSPGDTWSATFTGLGTVTASFISKEAT